MEDQEGRRPMWVGPGMVLMIEGANAWVSIRGEVWKCAHEQLRRATEEEIEAKELLKEEFEESHTMHSKKVGKDGNCIISRVQLTSATKEKQHTMASFIWVGTNKCKVIFLIDHLW